jgi:hypothetical protein
VIRAAAAATALCATVGAVALASDRGAGEPAVDRPPAAVVLDCRDRITGAWIIRGGRRIAERWEVDRRADTVIGPVAFSGATAAGRSAEWRWYVEADQWLKSIALVRAGEAVTLEVPAEQRGWMRMEYAHVRGSAHAVTLRGCRRRTSTAGRRRECGRGPRTTCWPRRTPFSGGFTIDYAHAPRQGRCAELIVWVAGRERPLRERLFSPPPEACA